MAPYNDEVGGMNTQREYYRYYVVSGFENPLFCCDTFPHIKDTPEGAWIFCGRSWQLTQDVRDNPAKFRGKGVRWVSHSSKKRFAHPTKEEAWEAFHYRAYSYLKHLQARVFFQEQVVSQLKVMTKHPPCAAYQVEVV